MVMDSGRRTLLQGNLAMQQRLFQKELQKAGQEICSSGLLDEEKGVALGAVARQFLKTGNSPFPYRPRRPPWTRSTQLFPGSSGIS
jgi:hypothetical protein